MPSGDNQGESGGGGSPTTSFVDVVGAVGDGLTPVGGPVSKSAGVNPRGSPARPVPPGDDTLHQQTGTEFELHANSANQGFLSSESSEVDSDARHRRRVKTNLQKRLGSRKTDTPNTGTGAGDSSVKEIDPKPSVLSTNQGQELGNLQALLALAQQLQAGSLAAAPSSGTARSGKGKKRKLSESSDDNVSSASESDSDDPFVDKKRRVEVDSEQEQFIDKVYRDWLTNKEAEKTVKNCFPLKKGVTVPRVHDDWMLNLVDRSAKSKVEAEDMKLYRLSKKAQLISGPLFKAWSVADDKDDKEAVKFIKKAVLALGQLQLSLNHERRLLSYGELCKDHKKAKDHLKESSSAFGKVARKSDKPALFGDKFRRAVIDRGAISKQLKEAKAQFGQKSKGRFQPREQSRPGPPTFASPLQKVQPLPQQQGYQSQPFPKDPTKKASGRGRGRYVYQHFSQGTEARLHGTAIGSARCSEFKFCARTNIFCTYSNSARGVSLYEHSARVCKSRVTRLSSSRQCRRSGVLLFRQLESYHSRSLGLECGKGRVPDRMGIEALSNGTAFSANFQSRDEQSGGHRSSGDDPQRCYNGGGSDTGSVREHHFLGHQERRRNEAGDKFEAPQSSGSVRTFSDGGPGFPVKFSGGQRLSDQVGSERCIFYATNSSERSEVSPLQMEGEALSISGSSLRPFFGSPGIHSGNESTNVLLEMPSIQECRLLGRHLSRQPARSGSSKDPGNSMAVITSGVHHKLDEILRTSISERGVSGVHCGFSEPIGNPSSDEGGQDNFHMYGSARTQGLRVANSSVFDWQVAECLDGNSSGTASFPIDADGKHQGFGQGAAKLCCPSGIARRSIVGAEVVGSKSLDLERKVFSEPRPRAGYCNHFRCQSLGLGCRVPRPDNPGTVVSDGDVTAHQCTGTEGSRASSKVFQGPLGGQPCSVTTGQYNCSIPDSENGVTSVKKVFGGDQRDMGICIVAREHDYCSAYSRQTEHHRRLPESDFQGQQQLEAVSAGISKSAEDVSLDRGRSVCRSFEPSSSKILELETRSTSRGRRRTDSGLEGDEGIRLSTLPVNSQSVKESSERESDFTPYRSCVASTGLVPDVVEDADRAASADTSVTTSPHCSRWVSTSHVSEPEAGPSGLAGIRGPVKGPELSADARDLVAKARSSGTIRAYKSGWQKFYRWCGQRQVNPFSCPVELVVNFLAEQQRFVLFGTLAGYRSAISHFHVKVDGVPVGKHPLVVEVMKGSFRDNPPVPRYTHTWDINIVLTYLQEMGPNAGLSQKELTLKLAMLLALVCRARGHELHAINPQAISWFEDKAVCHILGMTKTKTQSKPHKSFEIMRYKVSNNIDPVQCLQSYLHLTASQRESGEQKSHLFLSFASPHHAIKTCTIARWLKIVMADAGVDLSKFKAHSTRAAAVSKVPLSGLSVMEIAKLGDWSNATTFYKFYKKEIQVSSSESAVQGSILSLS